MRKTIVVLGGYGNFGKRICEALSACFSGTLIIAGRDLYKASVLCEKLRQNNCVAQLVPLCMDIQAENFSQQIKTISPFLVIHTSGPFQGQDYAVPYACIEAGAHYVDLADDRRFVCDIIQLDGKAKEKNLLVVSGASSVPGLSSTVIDDFSPQFSRMDLIDIAIAPGNRAERGAATVKGILSYTGHPISVYEKGGWINKYGWMSPRKLFFGDVVGWRLLANVEVPDLELFPQRYSPVKTVNFQAGLELPILHWGMVAMAWLAKKGWVKNWAPLVKPIVAASNGFIHLGSDVGGMRIHLQGVDQQGHPLDIRWHLIAKAGVGPYIPTLSAIIIAQQLLNETPFTSGATPCLGLYSLKQFSDLASGWGIYQEIFINNKRQV